MVKDVVTGNDGASKGKLTIVVVVGWIMHTCSHGKKFAEVPKSDIVDIVKLHDHIITKDLEAMKILKSLK